ncbi:hypothetical protein FRUB_06560 [Fimbriiglobus ruber]|uniref:Uncharacterized protein n=1 Tax=Fimbriiglobus ruber TaxID=1908690 RepID=A0A225D767_9BACT|nr:hypothetical protein FRUB_06560 [Fimbriiglobus ruber]
MRLRPGPSTQFITKQGRVIFDQPLPVAANNSFQERRGGVMGGVTRAGSPPRTTVAGRPPTHRTSRFGRRCHHDNPTGGRGTSVRRGWCPSLAGNAASRPGRVPNLPIGSVGESRTAHNPVDPSGWPVAAVAHEPTKVVLNRSAPPPMSRFVGMLPRAGRDGGRPELLCSDRVACKDGETNAVQACQRGGATWAGTRKSGGRRPGTSTGRSECPAGGRSRSTSAAGRPHKPRLPNSPLPRRPATRQGPPSLPWPRSTGRPPNWEPGPATWRPPPSSGPGSAAAAASGGDRPNSPS